jgi:PAS domain-containing protein
MNQDTLKGEGLVRPRGGKRQGSSKVSSNPITAVEVATWDWDLASGRVDWDEGLRALFGYGETATDAAWREGRIHPDDRERVKLSLERATIVNHGAPWSEEYRFRKADGSYATVCDRARVVQDAAGPCRVLGAISPKPKEG